MRTCAPFALLGFLLNSGLAWSQEPPASRVDAHAAVSTLSDDAGDWRETSATYSYRSPEGWSASADVQEHDRFGVQESYFEVRLLRELNVGTLQLAIGAADEGIFKPRLVVRSLYTRPVGDADAATRFIASLDAAWYESTAALSSNLGIEQRLTADGWFGRVLFIGVVDRHGGQSTGAGLQVHGPLFEGVSLYAGYAGAPEISDGQTIRASSWNASLVLDINDTWQWRLDALTEDRGAYRRNEFGFGTAMRF